MKRYTWLIPHRKFGGRTGKYTAQRLNRCDIARKMRQFPRKIFGQSSKFDQSDPVGAPCGAPLVLVYLVSNQNVVSLLKHRYEYDESERNVVVRFYDYMTVRALEIHRLWCSRNEWRILGGRISGNLLAICRSCHIQIILEPRSADKRYFVIKTIKPIQIRSQMSPKFACGAQNQSDPQVRA